MYIYTNQDIDNLTPHNLPSYLIISSQFIKLFGYPIAFKWQAQLSSSYNNIPTALEFIDQPAYVLMAIEHNLPYLIVSNISQNLLNTLQQTICANHRKTQIFNNLDAFIQHLNN